MKIIPLPLLLLACLSLAAGTQEKKDPPGEQGAPTPAAAEKRPTTGDPQAEPWHYEISVTATRTEKPTFAVPAPITVDNRRAIQENAPNNVSDLLLRHPGLDVTGVGPNQSRPVIRGLRGQRILLLADGLRLNSSRRQQDFGEIPAMVDTAQVERVEVVRGPASVLYGSDAIGGVVNIITRQPVVTPGKSALHGSLGWQYDSAGENSKEVFGLHGGLNKWRFMLSGSYRKAGEYEAPGGDFGKIHLADAVTVHDTGLQDHSLNLLLGYAFSGGHTLDAKYEYYNSNDAGFGFVDPALYAPQSTDIRITYPFQTIHKLSLHYEHRGLKFPLADALSLRFFRQANTRRLDMDIFVPFNIPRLPGAGLAMAKRNHTDITSWGGRVEATKVLHHRHILVFGSDFFRDDSENSDTSTTATVGMGQVKPQVSRVPEIPDAWYGSLGLFLQDEINLARRATLILGVRYQDVTARTRLTPGLENTPPQRGSDRTWTGAVNFIYGFSDRLNATISLGRGFRSPNLIERFFNGLTPEGRGYQSSNPGLAAETSFNADIGFKWRTKQTYLEATVFRNTIHDGIRVVPTGGTVNGIAEYRNTNIDKLRMEGYEALGEIHFAFGLHLSANYTRIRSRDLVNPDFPYISTFSSKLVAAVRFEDPRRRFWLEYRLRRNGSQKDMELVNNPIGTIIPGFTVHDAALGVRLLRRGSVPMQIVLILGNLGNTLYAEFSNASFFRPAPGRHLALGWSMEF